MAGVIRDYGNAEWVDKKRVYTDTQNMAEYKKADWVDEFQLDGALAGAPSASILPYMNLNDKRYALRVLRGVADTEAGSYP